LSWVRFPNQALPDYKNLVDSGNEKRGLEKLAQRRGNGNPPNLRAIGNASRNESAHRVAKIAIQVVRLAKNATPALDKCAATAMVMKVTISANNATLTATVQKIRVCLKNRNATEEVPPP
jgi:hypothetical protein